MIPTLIRKIAELERLRTKYPHELWIPYSGEYLNPDYVEQRVAGNIGYVAIREKNRRYYLFENEIDKARAKILFTQLLAT